MQITLILLFLSITYLLSVQAHCEDRSSLTCQLVYKNQEYKCYLTSKGCQELPTTCTDVDPTDQDNCKLIDNCQFDKETNSCVEYTSTTVFETSCQDRSDSDCVQQDDPKQCILRNTGCQDPTNDEDQDTSEDQDQNSQQSENQDENQDNQDEDNQNQDNVDEAMDSSQLYQYLDQIFDLIVQEIIISDQEIPLIVSMISPMIICSILIQSVI